MFYFEFIEVCFWLCCIFSKSQNDFILGGEKSTVFYNMFLSTSAIIDKLIFIHVNIYQNGFLCYVTKNNQTLCLEKYSHLIPGMGGHPFGFI